MKPFAFYTELRLVVLTGRSARNLEELLQHLDEVSGSSIFYHTHFLYLVHHFEKPKFYDDFADWASEALQDQGLAERLAAIDLLSITSIRDLRDTIISVIRRHVAGGGDVKRVCPPGDEFHFCEAKSFVMPMGLEADSIPDFFSKVAGVSTGCLHFHFFEARLRLGHPTNDFSEWLRTVNQSSLARRIDHLNPYSMSLDELKTEIVKLGRRYRSNGK